MWDYLYLPIQRGFGFIKRLLPCLLLHRETCTPLDNTCFFCMLPATHLLPLPYAAFLPHPIFPRGELTAWEAVILASKNIKTLHTQEQALLAYILTDRHGILMFVSLSLSSLSCCLSSLTLNQALLTASFSQTLSHLKLSQHSHSHWLTYLNTACFMRQKEKTKREKEQKRDIYTRHSPGAANF